MPQVRKLEKKADASEKPVVRVVLGGGDGLKRALQLLAKKVLDEKERREKCAQESISG